MFWDQARRSNIKLPLYRLRRTNERPDMEIDASKLDFSDYCKNIMAQADKVTLRAEKTAEEAAKKAEKMAQEAEKIGKKVAEDAEEFVRNKHRPVFHHPHDYSDNHDGRALAPATTIYHHYHHGQATVTETSTATVTSTSVSTSATTITYTALITSTAATTVTYTATSTAAAASVTTAPFDTAAVSNETCGEDVTEHVTSPVFWILFFALIVNFFIIHGLLKPNPKTKSILTPKQRTPSLMGIELDISPLKPYITTRSRQVFAVVLCKVVIALYFLESYWYLGTIWRGLKCVVKEALSKFNHWFIMLVVLILLIYLVALCGVCVLGYMALDQQFALDGELVMLELPTNNKPRNDANIARRQEEMDGVAMESESEGDWQKDGFSESGDGSSWLEDN